MIKLEFTSTECIRPELNAKSYAIFHKNLRGINWKKSTLFLNIDPLPVGADPQGVIDVAEQFFGHVVHNITKKPNATAALQWCWLQPTGPYFFHLQADWRLAEKININDMIKLMRQHKLSAVNLRAYKLKFVRMCLSPSLVNTKCAKRAARALYLDHNAERQLWKRSRLNSYGRNLQRRDAMHWPKHKVIFDIGREWLEENKFGRNNGVDFTTWADI